MYKCSLSIAYHKMFLFRYSRSTEPVHQPDPQSSSGGEHHCTRLRSHLAAFICLRVLLLDLCPVAACTVQLLSVGE